MCDSFCGVSIILKLTVCLLFLTGCQTQIIKPVVSKTFIGGDEYKYPKVTTNSVKNSLQRLSGDGLSGTYLFREFYSSSFVGGVEGHQGEIILELWSLDSSQSPNKILWRIEKDSDKWYFEEGKIVFVKRGCCGVLDKHFHYKISNGQFIKVTEHSYLRKSKNEPVSIYPG